MRLRLKGHCIYGTFLGYKDSNRDYVLFLDEETNKTKTYHKSKVEKSLREATMNFVLVFPKLEYRSPVLFLEYKPSSKNHMDV